MAINKNFFQVAAVRKETIIYVFARVSEKMYPWTQLLMGIWFMRGSRKVSLGQASLKSMQINCPLFTLLRYDNHIQGLNCRARNCLPWRTTHLQGLIYVWDHLLARDCLAWRRIKSCCPTTKSGLIIIKLSLATHLHWESIDPP